MSSLFAKPLDSALVLASGSPRRRELLQRIGLEFSIETADVEEVIRPGEAPREAALRLAVEKGAPVAARHPAALVLSADTLVVHQGRMLGKPASAGQARDMLAMLSGCWHEVLTAWAIQRRDASGKLICFQAIDRTRVRFHDLESDDIHAYVDSGEPMDKAGAYGIQDLGSLLVAEIKGDYFTVMGLPVSRVVRDLRHCDALWS